MKEYDFCHFFLLNSPVFNNALIDLLQNKTISSRHLFVCLYKENYEKILEKKNAILDYNIIKTDSLAKYLKFSKYIVVHSLEYSKYDLSLIDSDISSRIIWSVWGHDLYIGINDSGIKSFLRKIKYCSINPYYLKFRNTVRNFRAIFCGFEQDFLYIKRRYRNYGLYSALYPSGYYLEDVQFLSSNNFSTNNKIQILLGHNASPFLKHIKNLKRLIKYKNYVDIHIPLSYGSAENATKVIDFAKRHFDEDSVHFYMDFMNSKDYIKLLSKMDIAIFDIKYQAAFGNIILLLYLGKKIYLNTYGVMYKGLKSQGLDVYDVREIGKVDICDFSKSCVSEANISYGKNHLDKNYIISQWNDAFDRILEEDSRHE